MANIYRDQQKAFEEIDGWVQERKQSGLPLNVDQLKLMILREYAISMLSLERYIELQRKLNPDVEFQSVNEEVIELERYTP